MESSVLSSIDFCIANKIVLVNYAPVALAKPAYLSNPTLMSVAAAHGITPAQASGTHPLARVMAGKERRSFWPGSADPLGQGAQLSS